MLIEAHGVEAGVIGGGDKVLNRVGSGVVGGGEEGGIEAGLSEVVTRW